MPADSKISKYVEAITSEAKTASDAIMKQIESYKISQLDKIKASAKLESELEINRRISVIHEDIGRDFSEKEVKLRKQLFYKRDEIKSSVFKKAQDELISFSKSDEYENVLVNSIKNIKSNLVGIDKVISVYIKEDDLKYKQTIEQAANFPCEFIVDKSIVIGGIKAKFSKLVIDDTLDSRLASLSGWFEENSSLDIK